MTKEFENLLNLLKSGISENIMLGLQVAQNYKSEFEAYFGCSLDDYNELYRFLNTNVIEVLNMSDEMTEWADLNISDLEDSKLGRSLFDIIALVLRSNKLLRIPKSIKMLTKLKDLRLNDNLMKKIPNGILQLENLEVLYLYNNPLEVLPIKLARMKKLQKLHIDSIQRKKFAKEINLIKSINPVIEFCGAKPYFSLTGY